jgi:hypothetical protein
MMRNAIKLNAVVLAIVWLVLLSPANLCAQRLQGSITGEVKDSSGALIAGATVTVTNQGTGDVRTVQTKTDGGYLAPDLQPGVYTVSGEAKGFKRLTISGLNVNVGTTLTQDLSLEVGAVTETINVTGTTSLVETTTNMVGTTVSPTQMLELPLADRQIFALISFAPGMIYSNNSDNPNLNRGASLMGPGVRTPDVLPTLDGMDNSGGDGSMSLNVGYIELQPPPDALQEFRVETNNLSAEYGHGQEVIVNAVTKGGTNQFHGDLYEDYRSQVFDAAGWTTTAKPPLRQNIPGLTIGGPIRKNKTFFFFSYQYLYAAVGNSTTANVGLPAFRTGDFSQATRDLGNGTSALVPIYDPATYSAATSPATIQQFQCNGVLNVICPARLNPVATTALSLSHYPLPNHAPTDPLNYSGNFQDTNIQPNWWPFYMGRVDQEFNPNNKVYFRYMYSPLQTYTYGGGVSSDPILGNYNAAQHNFRKDGNYVVGWTHLFSPTFFGTFGAGVQHEWLLTGTVTPFNINYGTVLGIGAVVGPGVPSFGFGGSSTVPVDSFGGGTFRYQGVTNEDYTANFTNVRGSHTLKFGGQWEHFNNNYYLLGGSFDAGSYTFNGTYTQGISATGTPVANTGLNFADFLLGDFSAVTYGLVPSWGLRFNLFAGYFQDDWRVTPNLTLNLGLRYETTQPAYSPHNVMQSFNPSVPDPGAGTGSIPVGARGEMLFENLDGTGKYMTNWVKDGFTPRLGFAYRLFGKSDTVLRGGFALMRTNPFPNGINPGAGYLGQSETLSESFTANTNPSPVLGPNAVPLSAVSPPPHSAFGPTFGNIGTQFAQSSINFWQTSNPYAMDLNLSLQHQWKGFLIDLGYFGNFDRHVPISQNINMVPPALLGPGTVALRRPFTEFTGNNASVTDYNWAVAVADYNAMTLKVEHRYSNGFSWISNFTWEKWLTNAEGPQGAVTTQGDSGTLSDIYNLRGEKSKSPEDIPFRLVFSPIYELPFGKGKHWLNQGGAINQVVGGWQGALMGTFQTGSPLGPTVSGGGNTYLNDANQTLRPNLVPGCNLKSPTAWQPAIGGVRGIQYVNPACFTLPANYTYGDQPRLLPNLRGPGLAIFNISASKNFYIKERYRVQFRAEAVDAFNTPLFSAPNDSFTPGGSTFGLITGAVNGIQRRIMDFQLKIYF